MPEQSVFCRLIGYSNYLVCINNKLLIPSTENNNFQSIIGRAPLKVLKMVKKTSQVLQNDTSLRHLRGSDWLEICGMSAMLGDHSRQEYLKCIPQSFILLKIYKYISQSFILLPLRFNLLYPFSFDLPQVPRFAAVVVGQDIERNVLVKCVGVRLVEFYLQNIRFKDIFCY